MLAVANKIKLPILRCLFSVFLLLLVLFAAVVPIKASASLYKESVTTPVQVLSFPSSFAVFFPISASPVSMVSINVMALLVFMMKLSR